MSKSEKNPVFKSVSPPKALVTRAEALRKQHFEELATTPQHIQDEQSTDPNQSPYDSGDERAPALNTTSSSISTTPSVNAEYELCSWLLRLTPELIPVAMHINSRLKHTDFFEAIFANIYRCAMHFVIQNKVSGISAVTDYAAQQQINIGSTQDLTDIISDVISQAADVDRIQQDVDIILDHSQRRAMRLMLLDYVTQLDTQSAVEVKTKLEANLHEFASLSSADNEPTHISELMEKVLESLDEDEDALTVIPTGFTALDEQMGGGLRGGDYVVVGARPSMGKTAWALNTGRNVSMDTRHHHKVLVFSGEMQGQSLASRMLAAEAAVPASVLRKGGDEVLGNAQYMNSLLEVIPRFANFNPDMPHTSRLWIDDQSGLNASQITTRARHFVRRHGKALIIVDYLQFIAAGDYARMTRNEQVSAISREFKNLARELDCPVIMLSQLSRELEKRADKRPIMSDLRESGAIEQDADSILFLYRDIVYNPDTPEPDMAEVIIGKQRDGATGVIPLTFSSQYVRFSSRFNEYYDG